MIELTEIVEGETKLLVPVNERLLKCNVVFYNPVMEMNRDISVAIARVLKLGNFCDVLAGSGARGVRFANEAGYSVVINDINPNAYELIEKNIELNNLDVLDAKASNLDANLLLSGSTFGRFEFIDIDPFGSPTHFIDSALRCLKNRGVLGLASTDTAPLCGTYLRACRRKYDAVPLRTEYYNELGLRILIGYVARVATKYDLGIEVLFSHCTKHYFRTYLRVCRGRRYLNKSLENLKFIQHCFNCSNRTYKSLGELEVKCECGTRLRTAGLLWAGNFADPTFCADLLDELEEGVFGTKNECMKLVNQIKAEQEVSLPYYSIHNLCMKLKIKPPTTNQIIQELEEKGFKAKRTHFSGVGLRGDSAVSGMYEVLSS